MALTDLTGTTWTLNDSLTSYAGGTYSLKTYSVNITTETPLPTYNGDADTFVMLTVGYDSGGETNVAQVYTTSPASWDNVAMFATGNDTKTLPDTWRSGYYEGTFTVTGGTDATNSTLIAWMEDNCTQYVPPTPDVVVTYEGANIVELSEAGTKTLKTAGKYLTDDVVLAYSGGSGGGVETAHISADLSMGGNAYYTNANGEVCTEQVDYDTGTVGINDVAIVGSLIVLYALTMPPSPPTGATFVKQISSQKGNIIVVYQVTG